MIGVTEHDRVDHPGERKVDDAGPAPLTMHYFDSRGVFRVLDATIDDEALRFVRIAPGFSQRYTGRFADGDHTLVGQWEMSEDGVHWRDDLQITYRRA